MRLISEIITIILLLIISDVIYFMISKKIKDKTENETENENKKNIIKNIKLICIYILAVIVFLNALDIYNILIKNTNWNIHVFGVINYSKINLGTLNSSFVFSVGQFFIYLNILFMLIFKSKSKKIIFLSVCIIAYIISSLFRLYNVYDFYKNSKEYNYLKNYNIIEDFKKDNQISDKGALKILQEEIKFDYVKKVKFELTNYEKVTDQNIKYSCDFQDFWIVKFDYMRNYEIYENVTAVVDLYTGESAFIK